MENSVTECPRCGYPGPDLHQVRAGSAPKQLTKAERKRRAVRLAAARLKRWPKKE